MPAIWRGESATTSYTIPASVAAAKTLSPGVASGGSDAPAPGGVAAAGSTLTPLQPVTPRARSKHVTLYFDFVYGV
jgi:hypothetical protein